MKISLTDIRARFSEVVNRARFGGKPTFVTNRGEIVAVVVSYKFYQKAVEKFKEE